MNALAWLIRIEILSSIREFSSVLFGLLLPVGIISLLGVLYGDGTDGGLTIELAVPAVMTIGICASGLMGLPLNLSSYREKKILKRFQVTPISPALLLAAQFINQTITAVLSAFLVWLVARLWFGYELMGSWGGFIMVLTLVLFSIYAIGLCIASVAPSTKSASLIASLLYFPMFFLSGATIPFEIMPAGMQWFAQWMPLTQGIILLKAVSLGESLALYWQAAMILLVTGTLAMVVSVKTFRYEY